MDDGSARITASLHERTGKRERKKHARMLCITLMQYISVIDVSKPGLGLRGGRYDAYIHTPCAATALVRREVLPNFYLACTSACALSDDLGTNLCCGTHLVTLGLLPQRSAGWVEDRKLFPLSTAFPIIFHHTHTSVHISTAPLSVFRSFPYGPAPASQSRQSSKSCWITIIEPKTCSILQVLLHMQYFQGSVSASALITGTR